MSFPITTISSLATQALVFAVLTYFHGKNASTTNFLLIVFMGITATILFPDDFTYYLIVLLYIATLSKKLYGLLFIAVTIGLYIFFYRLHIGMLIYLIPFFLGAFNQTGVKAVFFAAIALSVVKASTLFFLPFFIPTVVYLYIRADTEKVKQQIKRFKNDSLTDGLTQIYNKAYYEKIIPDLLQESEQIAFMFLDIDHFKAYNDTHGHNAGDLALKRYAMLFLKSVKFSDTVIRWGGEEFVIILPNTTLSQAYQVALRIQRNVNKLGLTSRMNETQIQNTVSIGISAYPTPSANKKDLEENADKSLYEAKIKRNDIIVFGQPNIP